MNVDWKVTAGGQIIGTITPYSDAEIAARKMTPRKDKEGVAMPLTPACNRAISEKGNISLANGSAKIQIGDKTITLAIQAYYRE